MTQPRTDVITVDKARSAEVCLKVLSMLSGQDPPFQVAEAVAGTIVALLGLVRADVWNGNMTNKDQLERFVFDLSTYIASYDFGLPSGDANGIKLAES